MRMSSFVKNLDIVQPDIQKPGEDDVSEQTSGRSQLVTHWSTDLRVPVIDRSFLSSTVTRWSVKVLNTEKISWKKVSSQIQYRVQRLTMMDGRRSRRVHKRPFRSPGIGARATGVPRGLPNLVPPPPSSSSSCGCGRRAWMSKPV